MSRDKRTSDRQPMFRVCRYQIDGRWYVDLSTNISARGIFIKNFAPPPIGTDVTLEVTLPEEWGNLPLHLQGRVAWVNVDEDSHKRGMGIEFLSVRADSLPIIEYFVREVYAQPELETKNLTAASAPPGESAGFRYNLPTDPPEER